MRTNRLEKIIAWLMTKERLKEIICFILIIGGILWVLIRYPRLKEKEYYADVSNYITEEAVVDSIKYNGEDRYVMFRLSEIDDIYQNYYFIIKGKSVEVVLENEIMDKVKIGDRIQYTSAPAYFGNGYSMPIVELVIEGEIILSFEEGYENLLDLY